MGLPVATKRQIVENIFLELKEEKDSETVYFDAEGNPFKKLVRIHAEGIDAEKEERKAWKRGKLTWIR